MVDLLVALMQEAYAVANKDSLYSGSSMGSLPDPMFVNNFASENSTCWIGVSEHVAVDTVEACTKRSPPTADLQRRGGRQQGVYIQSPQQKWP